MEQRQQNGTLFQFPLLCHSVQPRRSERLRGERHRGDREVSNQPGPSLNFSDSSFPVVVQSHVAPSINMEDPITPFNIMYASNANSYCTQPSFTSVQRDSSAQHDHDRFLHVDLAWEMARASFSANNYHIVLNLQVCQVIGKDGVEELKRRLSVTLGGAPVVVQEDGTTENIRIMEHPGNQQVSVSDPQDEETATATKHRQSKPMNPDPTSRVAARSFGKKSKVPRPPNAFILYRQHWHPYYKSQHQTMHNNDISKEIGKRWKLETEDVKAKYRKLAEDLKENHALKNPGYHYAPRKPGEKKRRMTAKKLAKIRESQPHLENHLSTSPTSITGGFSSPRDEFNSMNDICETATPVSQDMSQSTQSPCPASLVQYNQDETDCQLSLPMAHTQGRIENPHDTEKCITELPDAFEDRPAFGPPGKHLFYTKSGSDALDAQAGWESLVDWRSVNESIIPAGEPSHLLSDHEPEESVGPESAFSFFDYREFEPSSESFLQ